MLGWGMAMVAGLFERRLTKHLRGTSRSAGASSQVSDKAENEHTGERPE